MTQDTRLVRLIVIWVALAAAVAVPLAAAAMSPQLQWRHPVYIAAGFAGIVAFGLLLVQPLLIGGHLPGLSARSARRAHRWSGGLVVAAVVVHVAALWRTSAPDVIDALLFVSPTPFSAWGVIAMWATFAAALFASLRRRLRLQPQAWRIGHTLLAVVIAVCTVAHTLLIEGTMETVSKVVFCALVLLVTLRVVADVWGGPIKRPREDG
jgi:predicted ferric reductase